ESLFTDESTALPLIRSDRTEKHDSFSPLLTFNFAFFHQSSSPPLLPFHLSVLPFMTDAYLFFLPSSSSASDLPSIPSFDKHVLTFAKSLPPLPRHLQGRIRVQYAR